MPNAKDYTNDDERFLAVGSTGAGKTAGFLTLSGKKFIYMFDPSGLSTLRGQDVDYELFTPDILNMNAVTLKSGVGDRYGKPPEPRTYVEFEEHFENALKTDFFNQYDVIGFDSMTTFQDLVMDRIMYLNGRYGKWPEQADWTATMNTIVNVMRTLTSIRGKTVYVTAHIEFKQEGDSGKMQNILQFIGRLRNKLPLLFSNIWQFYADRDKNNNIRFMVQTQPDRYSPYLRSTIKGLSSAEDMTVEDWSKPQEYGIASLLRKANK